MITIAESKLLVRQGQGQSDLIPQLIEFDVALTATESGVTVHLAHKWPER